MTHISENNKFSPRCAALWFDFKKSRYGCIFVLSHESFVRQFLTPYYSQTAGHGPNQDDLNVIITAAGRINLGGNGTGITSHLIHVISVSQPVQSWTVVRDHVDFVTLGNALATVISGIPPCPAGPIFSQLGSNNKEVIDITNVRNAAQSWLTNVLQFPGARESPAVRQFLCYGANSVPAQYQCINWISFGSSASSAKTAQSSNASANHGEDELDMDDMFGYDEGHADDVDEEEEDDYDDDADFFSATERYQPTEEAVTQDDIMDIQNNADDVEMIEDIGSLAQSMGASHLGRSLQLQSEIMASKKSGGTYVAPQSNIGLTNIGRGTADNVPNVRGGGIGSVVENAVLPMKEPYVKGLSDGFLQKAPISAPRLDSFKIIKVVGKGSFGKNHEVYRFLIILLLYF
jgi:hypothetical protein